VSPRERIDIDLNKLGDILKERGFPITAVGIYSISFEQSEEVTASILKSGAMIVKTSPKLAGYQKEDLLETYRSILIEGLGLPDSILPDI
jgi:hypothetical protein